MVDSSYGRFQIADFGLIRKITIPRGTVENHHLQIGEEIWYGQPFRVGRGATENIGYGRELGEFAHRRR